MTKEEKMIDVKCSVCGKDMQMPESFLKAGKKKGIDAMRMPHICSDCTDKMGDSLGDEKMGAFMKDVNQQMEKMGENNAIAEELAEEITYSNIDALISELDESDASEEDKIKEAFYRGAWMTLFLIGNNHEPGFLEKEAESIKDFHKKMKEREEREAEMEDGDEEENDESEE
ncbi:MAG: hypothetical protein AABX48_04015, partial [Nanoarchaeota archaeon]